MASAQENVTKAGELLGYTESEPESYEPYPDFTQIPTVRYVFVGVYLLVMVMAVVGNAVVCFTVFTNRKMHTAVNYYIVNLALCDLMVGIFVLPVKLLEFTSPADWRILNDALCTALMYLQTIFVFASVLTLVAICIERYLAVLHPLESRMHQTKARAKKILFVVWIIPCLLASPFLYPSEAFANTLQSEYGVISRLSCFIGLPENFRRGYYTFLFVFMYVLPLIFIAGTCIKVAQCLLQDIPVHRQGSIRRQEANRRKIAKMVLMVVFAFIVSWTPYFLVSITTQYQKVNFMHRENFFFTMLCINLFAFINSCVNPFIYASMSTRFRNGFRRCFRIICLVEMCFGDESTETNTDPMVANRNQRAKKVRFMCRDPMSCLITQSSSDYESSGSAARMSDMSQRTAVTMDLNGKRNESFIKSLIRKRSKREYISNCIKNDLKAKSKNQMNLNEFPTPFKLLSTKADMPILVTLGKRRLSRERSSSTGNISSEDNFNEMEDAISRSKKYRSCEKLNTESPLF